MQTRTVSVPEEILELLQASRLAGRPEAQRVRTALAIHLFVEGLISVGKAAELAGESRIEFESFLAQSGLPTVLYDSADYDQDLRGLATADRQYESP